jgi:uncharacterized protein
MPGERDLHQLLRNASPSLHPEVFVFCTLPEGDLPADVKPVCTLRETEGMTIIVRRGEAERLGLAHTFSCRMITLNAHSALDAVGFIAAITERLAARGISANIVSGYYHDHLFVPLERSEEAVALLGELGD